MAGNKRTLASAFLSLGLATAAARDCVGDSGAGGAVPSAKWTDAGLCGRDPCGESAGFMGAADSEECAKGAGGLLESESASYTMKISTYP